MTRQKAKAEMIRRWGRRGFIAELLMGPNKRRCFVWDGGKIKGIGRSWEAAFADYDLRAREGK